MRFKRKQPLCNIEFYERWRYSNYEVTLLYAFSNLFSIKMGDGIARFAVANGKTRSGRRRRVKRHRLSGRRFSDNDGDISYLCAHDFRNNIGPRYRNMTSAQRNPEVCASNAARHVEYSTLCEEQWYISAKNTGSRMLRDAKFELFLMRNNNISKSAKNQVTARKRRVRIRCDILLFVNTLSVIFNNK